MPYLSSVFHQAQLTKQCVKNQSNLDQLNTLYCTKKVVFL